MENDRELFERVVRLASQERVARAEFLVALGELDRRRLYLEKGFSSLFAWLAAQGWSNGSCHRRMTGARILREHPVVFDYLKRGLSLKKLCAIGKAVNAGNCVRLLDCAMRMTEDQVAELALRETPRTEAPPPPPKEKIKPVL